MVLKKPYAFLIKHFRLIHLIMCLLFGYLAYKTTSIVTFFGDFAASGTFEFQNNLAGNYITVFMYVAVILVLAFTIVIFYLMKSKEKSSKFYIATIVYYLIIFVMLTMVYGIMQSLILELPSVPVQRLYRDFSLILYLPQYFFIIFAAFRALGFDLKKFNFQKDLQDLEIEAKDSEEFEVSLDFDNYKIKRTLRRFWREFVYYIKENTFIFIIIVSIIIIILGTLVFYNRNVYHKVYKTAQPFSYKTFRMNRKEAYLTNVDYNGNVIKKGYYYLVINFDIQNNGSRNSIDIMNFRLQFNKEFYYPTTYQNEAFIDLGVPYYENEINRSEKKNYYLVYEIPESQLKNQYTIRIIESITYKPGEIQPKYLDILFSPKKVIEKKDSVSYGLGYEIGFDDSNIDGSKLTVMSYELATNYKYAYEYCTTDGCIESYASVVAANSASVTNTLLVLDYKLEIADSNFKINDPSLESFFSRFAKIRYYINGEARYAPVNNKTPISVSDKIVLQVNKEITNSDSIEMVFTIRDREFVVKLK